ncbi:MAG: hypothetical protein HOE70_01200 [Flavobacteriaceae bacterium]|jgi:hypothetical protein|nr:hypothetical protein [Flavobacteriaceae bacterium]
MKYLIILFISISLASCNTVTDMSNAVTDKVKKIGKNPCYDKETNTTQIWGCKKK